MSHKIDLGILFSCKLNAMHIVHHSSSHSSTHSSSHSSRQSMYTGVRKSSSHHHNRHPRSSGQVGGPPPTQLAVVRTPNCLRFTLNWPTHQLLTPMKPHKTTSPPKSVLKWDSVVTCALPTSRQPVPVIGLISFRKVIL